jgi:hypothetical protein
MSWMEGENDQHKSINIYVYSFCRNRRWPSTFDEAMSVRCESAKDGPQPAKLCKAAI